MHFYIYKKYINIFSTFAITFYSVVKIVLVLRNTRAVADYHRCSNVLSKNQKLTESHTSIIFLFSQNRGVEHRRKKKGKDCKIYTLNSVFCVKNVFAVGRLLKQRKEKKF